MWLCYNSFMDTYTWYQTLLKPDWAPPSWLFGPVWTVLYIGIFLSFGTVFTLALQKKIPAIVTLPFILNIICNAAFTPLQFTLRNNYLATVDIFLVLFTLLWAMYSIYPLRPWIAYAQVPYVLWVSFATVLQCTITYLNHT